MIFPSKLRLASLGALGAIALTFAGCAAQLQTLESAFSFVGTASAATVEPSTMLVAASTYDALEVTGKNYLKLKRCPVNTPVCRNPKATKPLINAFIAGRKARNAAINFVQKHPGQLGSKGVMDALNLSISTLQNILANYNVTAVVH